MVPTIGMVMTIPEMGCPAAMAYRVLVEPLEAVAATAAT